MRDPYAVLGVGKSAGEADIKKAFRKLAKAHHPDQNQNDPKAKERFAELNAAYEILGDKDKRAKFDRGEIDAEGKPRFHGFDGFGGGGPRGGHGGAGEGFESYSFGFGPNGPFGGGGRGGGAADMFSDMFEQAMRGRGQAGGQGGGRARQQAPQKGADIEAALTLSLESLVSGGHTRVNLPNGRTVEVAIPAQAGDGKTIRLKGQGQPSPFGGPPGDLLLTIRLLKHSRFTVEGADLRGRQDLPLATAVLGGPVRVETLEGAVELTIPPMTSGGRTFRLRGKGLPKADGRGDLYVSFDVQLPADDDGELAALMRRMKASV